MKKAIYNTSPFYYEKRQMKLKATVTERNKATEQGSPDEQIHYHQPGALSA